VSHDEFGLSPSRWLRKAVASPLFCYKCHMIINTAYRPIFAPMPMMMDLDVLIAGGRWTHCLLTRSSQINQFDEVDHVHDPGGRDVSAPIEEFARPSGVRGKAAPPS